jgi:hypothetical protein
MNEARTKLVRANALAHSGRNSGAIRLAEQADVDAQLARARAASERTPQAPFCPRRPRPRWYPQRQAKAG